MCELTTFIYMDCGRLLFHRKHRRYIIFPPCNNKFHKHKLKQHMIYHFRLYSILKFCIKATTTYSIMLMVPLNGEIMYMERYSH